MIPFSFIKKTTAAFTPLSLPSIALWYDFSNAGSVTTTGGNVVQINDQSANANNATDTQGVPPPYVTAYQNGLNVANFNNNQQLKTGAAINPASTAAASWFFLFQTFSSFANAAYIIDRGTSGDVYVQASTGDLVIEMDSYVTGAPVILSTALSTSTWYKVVIVWDSSQSTASNRLKVYLSGVDSTGTVDATGSGSLQGTVVTNIGFRTGSGPNSEFGHLAEFGSTNAAMTSTDMSNLDTYWATKWSV